MGSPEMVERYQSVLPCFLLPETSKAIHEYANALRVHAAEFRPEGMSEEDFWRTGLFHAAIERLRGQQSASMQQKRDFMAKILDFLTSSEAIAGWFFTGGADRFDYNINTVDGKTVVIESKGCLDGNNTNIYQRPPNADEFYIWSLCQNPGSDPRKNAWSGLHTRLSAEIVHRRERVDGVIIWDMLCGTAGRPCPKLRVDKTRATRVDTFRVPPPCVFLLPRSLPDPRNNPDPAPWALSDLSFASSLCASFMCPEEETTQVHIEARMKGADVQRKTTYVRGAIEFASSKWTTIRRSR